jgi:hypothetical protein
MVPPLRPTTLPSRQARSAIPSRTLSQPYGHLAAVLGTLRQLGLERDLDPQHSRQRDLVVAMIVARIVEPASKLATARGLGEEAPLSALVEQLGLKAVDEAQLYDAMDWLFVRQTAIEQQLASRHLHDGSLVLYDVTSTYGSSRFCVGDAWQDLWSPPSLG